MFIKPGLAALAAALLTTTGCAPGQVTVTVYGEEFIEQEIPAEVFVDGWSVRFEHFVVRVAAVELDGETLRSEPAIVDLAAASGGVEIADVALPADDYRALAFRVDAAGGGAAVGAPDAAVALLEAGPYAVYVAGEAVRAGERVTFAWGFSAPTGYTACAVDVALQQGGAGEVEITIHGDHLFYDDLFSETPNVAFDLIAQADGDGDGAVTEAELRAVDIRTQARYQVGSTGISDLWRFIERQTTTLGHVDGEGHCETAPLE